MKHIDLLNEKISMPEEACNIINDTIKKITSDEDFFSKYTVIHDNFFKFKETHDSIIKLASEKSIEPFLLTLTFCELFSVTTLELYKKQNISDDIFYETMTDLTIWAKVCKRDNGIWGMKEYSWVSVQLRAKLFRLGRLQFHLIKYCEETYTHAGVTVKEGDTVINIHIPEGDSLSKDKRMDSYHKAYKFFNQEGKAVFVCETWLFYPKHVEFLPSNSNILDFMRDFKIISDSESRSTANMWRIYGARQTYIPSELPRDTGMKRAYADWLASHGTTGEGYGVMIFDGDHIL